MCLQVILFIFDHFPPRLCFSSWNKFLGSVLLLRIASLEREVIVAKRKNLKLHLSQHMQSRCDFVQAFQWMYGYTDQWKMICDRTIQFCRDLGRPSGVANLLNHLGCPANESELWGIHIFLNLFHISAFTSYHIWQLFCPPYLCAASVNCKLIIQMSTSAQGRILFHCLSMSKTCIRWWYCWWNDLTLDALMCFL